MTTETEAIDIQHEYVTDAEFVPRMARAYTVFALTRPLSVVVLSLFAVIGVVALTVGVLVGEPVLAAVGAVYVLLAPITATYIVVRTRRGNARRLPVGSRIGIGMGSTMMRSDGPLGSSTASYAAYSRVHRHGDFVILRVQGVRSYAILPAELFPGADVETLSERVARANS